jgi:hypothetical protein
MATKKLEVPANSPLPLVVKTVVPRTYVLEMAGIKRRNLPRMVKPIDIPINGIVHGEILDIVDSPVSTIKGKLLRMKNETSEFLFPLTGVLRQALGDEPQKEVGQYLFAVRQPDGMSAKYKKQMFVFDVFTASKKDAEKILVKLAEPNQAN